MNAPANIPPPRPQAVLQDEIDEITANYLRGHKERIDDFIKKDAALKGKPRAVVEEIARTMPGVIAVAVHEKTHALYEEGIKGNDASAVEAERLSAAARARTNIDFHPGATVGENFFIDHGFDVIGEKTVIGSGTQLMQNVTLGAYLKPTETDPEILAHRHPVIGDDCFIGAGAKILGNVHVGDRVRILTNAILYGSKISVGDDARIGMGALIEDGVKIAAGVKIGDGAFIEKNSGVIDRDVPPRSYVFKDEALNGHGGELKIMAGVADRARAENGYAAPQESGHHRL